MGSKECLTAQSVRLPPSSSDEPEIVFDLKTLTVDHLRKLCTNVGIANCRSHNKFNCRKALATYFRYQDALETNGLKPTTHASRVTGTICRAVNVVFSAEFIEDFKTVNDRKSRKDHKTQKTYKEFWIRAALAHNSCIGCDSLLVSSGPSSAAAAVNSDDSQEDDDNCSAEQPAQLQQDSFCSLIFPPDDVYLLDLSLDTDINLLCVDQFETEAFRKKIMDLFKIRRKIKENMTESGTHDSDPWNFVECAMSGISGFTKIGVYYFYQRCEENIDIDGYFQPFLDLSMRGDTVSLLDDEDETEDTGTTNNSSSKRARVSSMSEDIKMLQQHILQQGGTILQHLVDAADERTTAAAERKSAALDRKKKMKFHARLEVAKALGDTGELRKLMDG